MKDSLQRILQVEKTLNSIIVGHEDFIRALMIGIVAGEHVIVIGSPGTAKSYVVRVLSKLLNANFYSYLLTKFTTYDEIFGAIDITALSKGEFKRRYTKIIESEFLFLDEVFKANSAILNALLSLLQERVVYDPMSGEAVSVKLHTCVGASNETPEDPELQALYDRFSIKVFVDYLDDDKLLLNALQSRWLNNINIEPVATMSDVLTLQRYALSLITAKVKDLGVEVYKLYHINVVPLIKTLRQKGILVSDRTVIEKLPKIYASYLTLYGFTIDNAMSSVFEILKYVARTRDELKDIQKVLDDALGEVAELSRKLEKAKDMIKAKNISSAKEILKDLLNYDISRIEKTPWLRPRVESILSTARHYLQYIYQFEEMIENMSKSL